LDHVIYNVAVKSQSEFTTRKGLVILGMVLVFYLFLAPSTTRSAAA